MVSAARYAFLATVWIYAAAILVQVLLAGAVLFGTGLNFELHRNLGWILHLGPVLLLIVAFVARVGATTIWLTVALVVVQAVQPLLPGFGVPWAAAVHPVLALVIFWLAMTIGVRAWQLVREPAAASAPAQSQA